MKRYFFDVVGEKRCAYDYRGRDCATLENACQLAELIALDCSVEAEEEWSGSTVKVRNQEGRELFSIRVEASSLAA